MLPRELSKSLSELNRELPRLISISLGIFALVYLVLAGIESRILEGWPSALIIVAAPFIGWLPAIFVHELGHALAAHLAGWRVWVFCVGPFTLRTHPRWTLRVRTPRWDDAGGHVLPTPKTAAAYTKRRDVMVTAGGPLASVLGAVVAYQLSQTLTADNADRLVQGVLVAFSASSLGCAALTVWPFAFGDGRLNDAAKIIEKLKSKRRDDGFAASIFAEALQRHDFDPARADAWIAEDFQASTARRGPASVEFLEAVVREDYGRAAEIIGDKQDGLANTLRAYIDVSLHRDAARAEEKLSTLALSPADWPIGRRLRDLTLAHIMFAAGENDDAEQRLEMAAHPADPANDATWNVLIERTRAAYTAATGASGPSGPHSGAPQSR